MRRIGLIAGPHIEATIRYLRQFDEQGNDRFGSVAQVDLFVNGINSQAFERAMKRQDLAEVNRICVSAAQQCAAAGAEVLLLGNSQLHVGADAVRKYVEHPLMDLVDATLSVATKMGVRRLALIGVRYAQEDAIWRSRCEDHGLIAAASSPEAADRVSKIVRDELSRGFVDGSSKAELVRLCADFRRDGARAVVLAAPELRLALGAGDSALPVIDATEAHVGAAITWAAEMQNSRSVT